MLSSSRQMDKLRHLIDILKDIVMDYRQIMVGYHLYYAIANNNNQSILKSISGISFPNMRQLTLSSNQLENIELLSRANAPGLKSLYLGSIWLIY